MGDSQTEAFVDVCSRGERTRYRLRELCRVGRSEDNDIVLDDDLTSRNHALVYSGDGRDYYINDLASSNGTTVNHVRVAIPTLLQNGDKIQIGNSELIFGQPVRRQETIIPGLEATNLHISQKLVTVMVVDIRGFTRLARRINARALSDLTGALVRESGSELHRQGAAAQKYIGDAVMAIWDHGVTGKAANVLGIFTAVSRIAEIARGLQPRFGLDAEVRLGAGLNTGLASVGNLGSVAASDYTALGDTVNLAFRLESASKEAGFDLLIGHETQQLAASHVPALATILESRLVVVKDYDSPVNAYGTSFKALRAVLELTDGGDS